ncbi:hypothetical protein COCNU_11G004520 [Cocos nucifera]|uniref:Uncharacterized protein n=1 Tax=Cocos nucifera TaxID=13894 RepID=A0A8K0IP27_COCNU|nr:hypothetical protein COCNU_11G004520 [Cocos nucifera]
MEMAPPANSFPALEELPEGHSSWRVVEIIFRSSWGAFITGQEVCRQKVVGHLFKPNLSFLDKEDGEAAKDQPQMEPVAIEDTIEPATNEATKILADPCAEFAADASTEA